MIPNILFLCRNSGSPLLLLRISDDANRSQLAPGNVSRKRRSLPTNSGFLRIHVVFKQGLRYGRPIDSKRGTTSMSASNFWEQLATLGRKSGDIKSLIASDPGRFDTFSARHEDMLLDYSRTSMTVEAKDLMLAFLGECDFEARRAAMFSGERINFTEGRAVLHTALRLPEGADLVVEGKDIAAQVISDRKRCYKFAQAVRSGSFANAGGEAFLDVVNIGIGGSDLGPAMVSEALSAFADGPRTHYVSNVDPAHLHDVLDKLDLARTLVIVASKTFTTQETMANAAAARARLEAVVGDAAPHFAALTTAIDKAADFGIPEERCFGFEEWVGGRLSVWSSIGLSVMIGIGPDNFDAFLAGAYEIDRHFQDVPLEENLSVALALIGVWHRNGCGYETRSLAPYDQRLAQLPAYLQQLDMESNGKTTRTDGTAAPYATCPVVWGATGTNGQHAYFQLLHQGSTQPVEFLVAARRGAHEDQHDLLLANCLAQGQALLKGRTLEEARAQMAEKSASDAEIEKIAPHRVFSGNRPSTLLSYSQLTPRQLGRLIALFEHRTFTEGVFWDVNSYDQWGVELGKELAGGQLDAVRKPDTAVDPAMAGSLAHLRNLREA